jgi:hypothetical protein
MGRLKVNAPMGPGSVVVLGVRAQDPLKMTLAEDKEVVEALSSRGAYPTLRDGVGFRGSKGCPRHGEAFGPKDLVEGPGERGPCPV